MVQVLVRGFTQALDSAAMTEANAWQTGQGWLDPLLQGKSCAGQGLAGRASQSAEQAFGKVVDLREIHRNGGSVTGRNKKTPRWAVVAC